MLLFDKLCNYIILYSSDGTDFELDDVGDLELVQAKYVCCPDSLQKVCQAGIVATIVGIVYLLISSHTINFLSKGSHETSRILEQELQDL